MSRSLYSFIFNSFLIYTLSIVAVFFISQLVFNPARDTSNLNHWHAQVSLSLARFRIYLDTPVTVMKPVLVPQVVLITSADACLTVTKCSP